MFAARSTEPPLRQSSCSTRRSIRFAGENPLVELGLIRRAAEILAYTVREFRTSTANGDGVRSAALASERMAYAQGAQDVRMLASMRDGGMPQPLDATRDPRADPLLACIAVRYAGYWAEGLITIASKPNLALAAVEAALAKLLGEIRPGIAAAALGEIANNALRPNKPHPFVSSGLGNGLGLSREEAPFLMANEFDIVARRRCVDTSHRRDR